MSPLCDPQLLGFHSLAGGADYPVDDYPEGCPRGRAAGRPTSLAAVYAAVPRRLPPGARMAAVADWLPYLHWAGLGESAAHRLRHRRRHHQGRHAVLVAAGRVHPLGLDRIGAERRRGQRDQRRAALLSHGATVLGAPDGPARWRVLERLVREEGWYSAINYALPASGSSAWRVEGYRSLALELAAEAPAEGWDAVLVPMARGDLIWGLFAGFAALRAAGLWPHAGPRLIAVEPFPRLAAVLAGGAPITGSFPGTTHQASTAGNTTTDQARRAVQESGGTAIAIGDAAAEAAQAELAACYGIFLELCTAAAHAAVPRLLAVGALHAGERVVATGTAAGQRDPGWPATVPSLEMAAA